MKISSAKWRLFCLDLNLLKRTYWRDNYLIVPLSPCFMEFHEGPTVPSLHYSDVIMSAVDSPITSLTIVYSIVNSGQDQRKSQSSASLAFVRGIHRWPVNSSHKGPVTQKTFPFHDAIMQCTEAMDSPHTLLCHGVPASCTNDDPYLEIPAHIIVRSIPVKCRSRRKDLELMTQLYWTMTVKKHDAEPRSYFRDEVFPRAGIP